MGIVAYTDYVYSESDGVVYADRAFALFLAALADHTELTIVGRLDRHAGASHYALPSSIRFVGLRHYRTLADPLSVIRSLAASVRTFWRVLDDAEGAWILGPYPHSIALAIIALARRRPLVLGVRQDYPAYVRSRRPGHRWMHRAADLLEAAWRRLARRCPVVVVGPSLSRNYSHSPAVLEIAVSLVSAADIEAGRSASGRIYDGQLRLLSVGRLDPEKNPLLLAEAFARIRQADQRWRLVICGEGPMTDALERRLEELGLSEMAEIKGYVPLHGGLLDLYRSSHTFLHVSLTEGMPQVLIEAFASGVPVVATAVGGVPDAVGNAALLIPPDDADAAADAVVRAGSDDALRCELIELGLQHAERHTLEHESARVAEFIAHAVAQGGWRGQPR